MKKLTVGICIAAFAITSGTINADDLTLTSHDDSIYTQVCIAAVKDGDRFEQLLNQYEIDRDLVRCNGKPLVTFVKKMTSDKSVATIKEVATIKGVATILVGSNESAETALCLAAAKSPEEFTRAKSQLFSDQPDKVRRIVCNEVPLNIFAARFNRRAIEG
ncbi:MAG: hypothetical protein ACI82A_002734 [Candidatus Azotimanducaceae bacterium]|jgi:hypothetical protein